MASSIVAKSRDPALERVAQVEVVAPRVVFLHHEQPRSCDDGGNRGVRGAERLRRPVRGVLRAVARETLAASALFSSSCHVPIDASFDRPPLLGKTRPMAARPISSATISFGLVSIPVKLFTTSASGTQISFNWLHTCGSRVKQQYFCPKDERVVARDELVKGYEFSKGQFVQFTPEELKALEEEGTETIEITEFLPLDKVDPLYFERAYYLGPDKGGDKPYRLLAEAMRETGRAAIARWAARGKQYLVLIRPFEDGLLLQQLRYADELKSFEEVERGKGDVKPAELKLAVQLVDQITTDAFRPEQYHDAVRDRMTAAIQRKVEGAEAITVESPAPAQAQIIDLVEALKASLEGGKDERRGPKRADTSAEADEKPAKQRAGAAKSRASKPKR
jgi:DNA end-binding protein Ku